MQASISEPLENLSISSSCWAILFHLQFCAWYWSSKMTNKIAPSYVRCLFAAFCCIHDKPASLLRTMYISPTPDESALFLNKTTANSQQTPSSGKLI
jgi:hypothetical protein